MYCHAMIYIFKESLWLLCREQVLRGKINRNRNQRRPHNSPGGRGKGLPVEWWLRKWIKADRCGTHLGSRITHKGRKG